MNGYAEHKYRRRLLWLTLFAVAMAYLEATVVIYLRQAHYPEDLLTIFPPRILSEIVLVIELAREGAARAPCCGNEAGYLKTRV